MNFKIGDKVSFLNEKGEGTVSKLINKTTVGITIEDGFEIPYAVSELVLIYNGVETEQPMEKTIHSIVSSQIKSNQHQSGLEKKVQGIKKPEQERISVAFSPEKVNDITNSDINVWLINNTAYQLLFTYSLFQNGNFKTLETGTAKPFESLLIETVDRKELSDFSTFKIEALFFDAKEHEHQAPISEMVKLKPIKLYKENAFTENSFIPEKALIMDVYRINDYFEETNFQTKLDLSKILFQKQSQSASPKRSKQHTINNPAYEMEINLHIEELLENYKGMSNAEIILVQLKHFQTALDTSINEHYRKLVIIHGVGNGRLKQEVRTILSSYKNLQFHDASYSKYGFGATEILIS
ncbi:MAG: DUF2027 domain-containing protein [Bacteroidota bacterium]